MTAQGHAAPVTEGDVLAGKYRVERVLGVGGMGVVVAARHLQLDEMVALKFMLAEAAAMPDAVERFLREAKAAVRLKSEHVARVLDVGTLENGAPFMVMEYLEGQDLGQLVRARGALPVDEAVEYVLQACEALAEAHSKGIVHRDLKPANLYVTRANDRAPRIKVLDFGISKVTPKLGTVSDLGATKTSMVMGSPIYMAPEQMKALRNADARSDIWALGVVLYEILTGVVPFDAETMPALCAMVMTEPPRPLRELEIAVPAELEAIVARCLAKDPAARFQNVAELASALARFGPKRSQGLAHRISLVLDVEPFPGGPPASVAPPRDAAEGPGRQTEAAWGQTGRPSAARARSVVVLAAAGVSALVLVGVLALGSGLGRHDAAEGHAPVANEPALVAGVSTASSAPIAPAISNEVAPVIEPAASGSASVAAHPGAAREATGGGKQVGMARPTGGAKPAGKAAGSDDAFATRR